jgi:para-nitrobenzyl esterase
VSTLVETQAGKLMGETCSGPGRDLVRFRGIPYAAPPVGNRRFRPPAAPEPWPGVRTASSFGPDAPQPPSPIALLDEGGAEQSEDCLTLNVWTPALDGARRPVMVWIHGGGFTNGSANRALYDGSALAAHGDVVVVTLNYRLGLLGLLTHPSLADEATGMLGGWGVLDQIAALGWVREHIERFGGDPERVTLFGESAGGASVAALTTTPLARGLFCRAMVQSASPLPATLEQSIEAAEGLCAELGLPADDVERLRGVDVARLLEATPRWREIQSRGRTAPRPARDGQLLPLWPDEAIAAGLTRGVELVVGSTRDEYKLFAIADPQRGSLDEAGLLRRVTRQTGDDEARSRHVIETYRSARVERGESTTPWELWCAIATDSLIRVPALRYLEQHTASGEVGYAYVVTWESPNRTLGACHAIELPFCFGTLNTAPGMHAFCGKGPEADRLMECMCGSWLAFAQGRGPGTAAIGAWPAYTA